MAQPEEQTEQSDNTEETNGSNGSGDTRKMVARAAAVAAATGATALAARKVLDRGNSGDKEQSGNQKSSGKKGGGADASLVTTMASTAWDSARDTVLPMIEDAAENAGSYVAQNAPDIVREAVVPRFIRGFEKAQESSSQDDGE